MGEWLCHSCGAAWQGDKRAPGPKETCNCGAYLHCCLNCRFHRPSAHNQCLVPNTEWVGDRRKGNFCDQFEFRRATAGTDKQQQTQARAQLDALFGKDEMEMATGDLPVKSDTSSDPRTAFNRLFDG